ncbi:hypothetical protein N184_29095 [Sinorhizobium sp. GL28]|nr:hypothetical protein N184_29095 [Sinorhizobium sp. GL28]
MLKAQSTCQGGADFVQRLAEGLAGPGRVIVRISCPRD